MTMRTFKQLGQAYATEPLTITASINDALVYQGTIPTVDQPVPPDPSILTYPFGQQLFTWELDTAFSGTVDMTFTVAGLGRLFLSDTLANYVMIANPDTSPGQPPYINGGPTVFGYFYQLQMPNYVLGDPFTNVKINGVDQTTYPSVTQSGQWCWFIEESGTFSATVNIAPTNLSPATIA